MNLSNLHTITSSFKAIIGFKNPLVCEKETVYDAFSDIVERLEYNPLLFMFFQRLSDDDKNHLIKTIYLFLDKVHQDCFTVHEWKKVFYDIYFYLGLNDDPEHSDWGKDRYDFIKSYMETQTLDPLMFLQQEYSHFLSKVWGKCSYTEFLDDLKALP